MAAVTILPKKCRSHITWWMVLRNASRPKLQQVCSHFHSFYFLFSSASCAFTFLLITLKWELTSPPSSSGCDVLFTAKWKTVDLNGWIACKTKLNLWSHFERTKTCTAPPFVYMAPVEPCKCLKWRQSVHVFVLIRSRFSVNGLHRLKNSSVKKFARTRVNGV